MQDSGFQVLLQGNNFLRILQGLGVTIGISIVSVLLSLLLGTLFGIVMTSKSKIVRFLSRIYLEFIRIMPQLVLLFIVYFGLARNFNPSSVSVTNPCAIPLGIKISFLLSADNSTEIH